MAATSQALLVYVQKMRRPVSPRQSEMTSNAVIAVGCQGDANKQDDKKVVCIRHGMNGSPIDSVEPAEFRSCLPVPVIPWWSAITPGMMAEQTTVVSSCFARAGLPGSACSSTAEHEHASEQFCRRNCSHQLEMGTRARSRMTTQPANTTHLTGALAGRRGPSGGLISQARAKTMNANPTSVAGSMRPVATAAAHS